MPLRGADTRIGFLLAVSFGLQRRPQRNRIDTNQGSGCIPRGTFGGLKARGHPVGASGAYQIVEAAAQLRGEAGANQVAGARVALTQSIGGHGSIAVTHVLEA